MPPSIPQEIFDLIIDQVALINADSERRGARELSRSCRLSPFNTTYLSSCALVARSWVWPSRRRQFRTLHFVNSRQARQLNGLLGLICGPLCTISNHVFEIEVDVFILDAPDMVALASLSNLQYVGLRGSWPEILEEVSWREGLPAFLASFAHLTKLEISFLPGPTSLLSFAALIGACSELQTLSIVIADLPHTYLPRHFPPPALRSLRITEKQVGGCDALCRWLSSAAEPLPIDSIAIQNYGNGYTASVLNLLRNARPSLENLEINTGRIVHHHLPQPPLPNLNPYPRLQSFTCRWSNSIRTKSPAVQAAEICTAIGQISSPCIRTINIIIDIYNPGDIEQELALQRIDPYLQRSNFASMQRLTIFTVFSEWDIMLNWARKCFPACYQRGIVQLRQPPRYLGF